MWQKLSRNKNTILYIYFNFVKGSSRKAPHISCKALKELFRFKFIHVLQKYERQGFSSISQLSSSWSGRFS